jgi:hypothetical protein
MKNLLFGFLMLSFVTAVAQTQKDTDFHLDKAYKMSATGVIDLSASDAHVFITGSNRQGVHVKIDRTISVKGWSSIGEFRVDVSEDNGNLKIREHQKGGNVSVGYYHEEYKIEIESPEGSSLVIRGDDGDYFIKNINGDVSLSLDDADAELTNCNGSKFVFRFDDGDLRMDKGKGSLEIDGDDTDIEIYNGAFTSIDATLDDGDLKIETSLSGTGNYHFRGQDGMIAMKVTKGGAEFDITHDEGNVTTHGDFKIISESEDHTRVALNDGKAKVRIDADDARIKLSAN